VFEVGPTQGMTFNAGAAMAISPDGRWMVFQAGGADGLTRFWLRSLDGPDLRPLAGTESIGPVSPPAAWSFDSRWVVFASGLDRMLKKVDIQGGPPQAIAEWPGSLNGASWNNGGVIIGGTAATGNPILKVSSAGGQATPITKLAAGETDHVWPQFLPDGKHFLYERVSSDSNKGGIYIGSIDAKPEEQSTERLLASDRQAYYAPLPGSDTGHLIFMRQGTLMAQLFDPASMKLTGEPVAIADQVDSFPARNYGLFSVSDTGALAYRHGSGPQAVLTWYDASGHPTGTVGEPGDYANPSISPDGKRIAVGIGSVSTRDIWILDVTRGANTRFTFDPGRDDFPSWSPDGKFITFSSYRNGQMDLYIGPADSPGQEKPLWKSDQQKDEGRWTKDGRFLLFTSFGKQTNRDVWLIPSESEKAKVLLHQAYTERWPAVSPDGRWLAYTSNESGNPEVYIRPFTPEAEADTGPKWLVSRAGGIRPLWRPDGKALHYIAPGGAQMMSVDIDAAKGFQAGTPKLLFAAPTTSATLGWDLSSDGRFLFPAQPGSSVTPFTVSLNWAARFKK